ncbi:MAG: ROK family protein [Acidimicrobiales bacterium]
MAEEPHPHLCLAIDIGGTKMAAGLVDGGGQVVWQDRTRTPRATDPEALFRLVTDLIEIGLIAARARGAVAAVGIGCGGPMRGELVSPLNIPAWREFPLAMRVRGLQQVEEAGVPVGLDNDAKALALAERWCGRAAGEANFLAMVVSTGIGGGLVLDGRLLDGESGNAGHVGHVIVEPDGRPCACGARGCLEAEASGLAIETITGQAADEAPREMRERAGRLVGRATASVVNLLDLRHVVVGGSVALGYGAPFFLAAQQELEARARLGFSKGARIHPVGLGADAPLVGAAAVGWRCLDKDIDGGRS